MWWWTAGLGAGPVYLLMQSGLAFGFGLVFTVSAVYRIRWAGLDPLQLVLVGTALEAAAFLFEVPTGVVADTFSRRLSIIVGVVLLGAAFILEGLVPWFPVILLAQVVSGLGYTFTSGATEAWLADEVGEERVGALYLRGAQAAQAAGIAGTLASVALASVQLNVPMVLGGGLVLVVATYLVVAMPERGFRPAARAERATWSALFATFTAGLGVVRRSPLLLTLMAITAFWGASSEGFDRLWEAQLLGNVGLPDPGALDPVVWFGLIRVAAMLLGIGVAELIRRAVDTADPVALARTLLLLTALLVASVIGFGLATEFVLAVAAYLTAATLRRVSSPLFAAWINQHLEPSVRATVISMRSQVDAFGQIGGGPIIGAVGSFASLRAALVVAALLLTPALPLFASALGRERAAERKDGFHA